MTTSEIINIVVTVAFVQVCCDLIANHFIYGKERYQRALGRLSREKYKLGKEETKDPTNEKQLRKLQKAKDDCNEAIADVARMHMSPQFFTSMAFLILYRILAAEYQGNVVAVLPFAPWSMIRKLSMRGIEMKEGVTFEASGGVKDINQVCSYVFIYILSTLSVKYYVSQAIATKAPQGADKGILSMVDAPQTQRVLKGFNLDNDSLTKID